jgi:opacity protein-like surface antigen
MKKFIMAAVVMLLLLSPAAFASVNSKKVHLSRIGIFTTPYDVDAVVNVENKLGSKLEDVHVTIVIPELGIRRRVGPFLIASGDEVTKRLLLDTFNAEPGEYYVRITVSNDNVKRVRHRLITI